MKKAKYNAVIISCLSTFALALGGCGGGGGGSTTVVRTTTPEVYVDGIAQEATYTASGTTLLTPNTTGVSASITTYDDDGTIQKIAITTPNATVTWDATSGDFIDNTDVVVVAENAAGTDIGVVVNLKNPSVPWQYQTFGVWETGLGTGSGTIGAITVGKPTTGSNIPLTGIATFEGISGGVYVDAAGTDYITASALSADVDFAAQTIDLATTATSKVNTFTAVESDATNLNMAGQLNYSSGINSFTGNVTATGLAGTSTGQFYGPAAEELGGVFSLTGTGVETYAGAYGAIK